MGVGRPSKFTQELADRLCEQLAEGMSMRKVCEAEDMPEKRTIFRWLRTNEEFCHQYEKAKAEAADSMTDEMLDIADEGSGDTQRDRLRVDTRKWVASKLKPKKYGDYQKHEHTGSVVTEATLTFGRSDSDGQA